MLPLQPLRTKEEIEANRLAAEEKLRKTRAEKAQKYLEKQNRSKNDENRIVLSADQRAFMAAALTSNSSTLTTEQKLRIEKNKQEALAKQKLKQQKKAEEAGLASGGNALSPEQKLRIEKNRQEALEKLRLKQQKKAEEAGLASGGNALSPEQKLRIEKNRQEALEKLRLKQQKKAEEARLPSSGKAIPPSKAAIINSRPEPYAKPLQNPSAGSSWGKPPTSSKLAVSSVQQNPHAKPQPSTSTSGLNKTVKPVECKMEAISETRFVVKTDVYHKDVINEFNKIASKIYNPQTHFWSFNLSDYEVLTKSLIELTTPVQLHPIPPWVLKHLRAEIPTVNASCLDCIDPILLETLFDYQKEGACFGIARGGRFLLADDMGLGKTFTALAVADFYKENWPLLIVTTAAMRKVWADTITEYLPSVNVQDIRVVESHNTLLAQSKIVICSYQGLDILTNKKIDMRYGMIIFDESHEIKNQKAIKTQNALKLAEKATRVVCLTGTPALSRPAELFQQLKVIDGKFATYRPFTQRYCEGYESPFGWNDKGSSNMDELHVVLQKKFMIRRTKDQTTELGEKVREKVELKDLKLTKTEQDEMRHRAEEFNQFKDKNKKKEENEVLLKWYTETAKSKAEGVARYIEDKLKGSDDKFLIFAHHICVLDAISEMLARVGVRNIRIDGSTRPDIRKSNVDSFQNDPNIRCAVLSMKACSSGLTLTAASTVIFAELDWNPSIMLQAEGRAHRIGQAQQVKSFFLIAPGTSDDIMWNKLQLKQRNLNPVGLVGVGDHFSQNMQQSKFDASSGPSTSGAVKSEKRITDYYKPAEDDDDDDDVIKQWQEQEGLKALEIAEEKSTESFYTCHENESLDMLMEEAWEEAEKAETPKETGVTIEEPHKQPNLEIDELASIEWDDDE